MSAAAFKASVVINTFNRSRYLRNAIASIATQSYLDTELIVVNGPSTDDTNAVLDTIEAAGIQFKRANCPNRNLSESRNIGLSEASGEVVLFIDDDAVAHRDWVGRLMATYASSNVGAAGGFTFDHTGVNFQCRYTVCDKYGNARFFDTIDPETFVGSGSDFYFSSLLGTNCSFRRDTLAKIGGFDEVFEYMLDETDVCVRIVERSQRVVTVPDAYVFHKYAPSETRTPENIPKSLMAPARSKAYFCFKHSKKNLETAINLDVIAEIERYRKDIDFSNKWFLDHKKISPAHYSRLCQELNAGIADGIRLGVADVNEALSASAKIKCRSTAMAETFARLKTAKSQKSCLKIYLVSQGYPPSDTSGIARWTHECASQLTARGHEVHVITRSHTKENHVDCREGIWIHSVIDVFDEDLTYLAPVSIPASIARRATAVLQEIKRSQRIWGLDVVSAPIWDVEGILCCVYLKVPVITSLHTTYKLAQQFKPEWKTNFAFKTKHVDKVIGAERWMLENSLAILANSKQVISEINHSYEGVLDRHALRVTTILHGIGEPITCTSEANRGVTSHRTGRNLKILFVGRLEERKGPDILLAALSRIVSSLDQVEIRLVGSAGIDSEPYHVRLVQLAESVRRKNPRVIVSFCGYVNDTELQEHYASADVLVVPSRFESFGLVLIEGMRHGVAIIAGDVGGMREIITDGVDGYLVTVDNEVQLADRLRLLVENNQLRAKVGESARRTYESRFTASRMAASMENMLYAITEEALHE